MCSSDLEIVKRELPQIVVIDSIQTMYNESVSSAPGASRRSGSRRNRIFQGCRAKEYSGRELKFPEMSPDVTLFDYQKDAVMRVISEKNTLLAFDVGAGKTYIMIAAAMKMRQEGKSRKNLFVVPNHIVGQWELIFKQMYPAAKVLSVGPGPSGPSSVKRCWGRFSAGIMTASSWRTAALR